MGLTQVFFFEDVSLAEQMRARRERVSGILLKRESLPGSDEVGGHDRDKHYLLSPYYSSTL